MVRKRLLSADRRALILEAAIRVFAEHGFDGAKTHRIAAEAQVSEALIFRHFPSKETLYRSVLRKLIRDQNEAFKAVGELSPDAAGLITMMRNYFGNCLRGSLTPNPNAIRILYASLAGDGTYARLTYRRSLRLSLPSLIDALAGARAAGDLVGAPIDPINIVAMLEHLGSNVTVARMREPHLVQYAGTEDQLLEQMILFCGRGIGLREEVIQAHLGADAALSLRAVGTK
ncbi:TetR family transcriptional regulator [Nitrospirillum bahiense]|uniref:TetR family transcriptional regulator n=1 Tax=Nitrospirillum amazonense TaxID=28077 RepID=A0A560FVI9_9PROT|nr:TetR family transcriptional regulator [Nitrospirillum amazonense]